MEKKYKIMQVKCGHNESKSDVLLKIQNDYEIIGIICNQYIHSEDRKKHDPESCIRTHPFRNDDCFYLNGFKK